MEDDPYPFNWSNFIEYYCKIVTTDLKGDHQRDFWRPMCGILEHVDVTTLLGEESRYKKIWGYLVLESQILMNSEGRVAMRVYIGDVVVQEIGWDRDVVITHFPICRSIVSPQIVKHLDLRGKLMPLYSRELIERFAKIRTEAYAFGQSEYLKTELH